VKNEAGEDPIEISVLFCTACGRTVGTKTA
jgi:hypothetical protein